MKYRIEAPERVEASIKLPASKSISNRALVIHALSGSTIPMENLSVCDDTDVMVRALGSPTPVIDIMAAGTAMRFSTAFFAMKEGETHIITGTERMQNRPIRPLVDALRSLGADIEYTNKEGFPPLKVTGKQLEGGAISVVGTISSQYISALLMVGPIMKNGLELTLTGGIISRPYILLTLNLMKEWGVESEWKGNTIKIKPQAYRPIPFSVESDWSAASYWYQIAALSHHGNQIELLGLRKNSHQGDSELVNIFTLLGVTTKFTERGVTISKAFGHCQKLIYNFIEQPDLAQTVVVTACMLNIKFRFAGLQSLKIKETDRIAALIAEMRKLGYVLTEHDGNSLEWNGERCDPEENTVIKTYEDHRMAMAFAPAALRLEKIEIAEPMVVTKSYPTYWKTLEEAGFKVSEVK